jgi:hypothetical protein
MSDTYETVDGSKIIAANDIAKYAEQLKRERDQWRECATKLAVGIAVEDDEQIDAAIAEFERLKGETK